MNTRSLHIFAPSTTARGEGELVCPRKGLIALARCEALQAETGAEGHSCTCDVFREQQRRAAASVAPRPASPGANRAAPSSDASATTPEVRSMSSHARTSKNCNRCKKPAIAGTHVYRGLCKGCRDEAALDAGEQPPGVVGPDDMPRVRRVEEPSHREIERAPRPALPRRAHLKTQTLLPVIADDEIKQLRRERAQLERRVERLLWLARGVVAGNISPRDLGRLLADEATLEKVAS